MSNNTSLKSIEFGQYCFNGTASFALKGMNEFTLCNRDLPQLKSVIFRDNAFRYTKLLEISNLISLQTIEFGQFCFGGYRDTYTFLGGASSFTLNGITELVNAEQIFLNFSHLIFVITHSNMPSQLYYQVSH